MSFYSSKLKFILKLFIAFLIFITPTKIFASTPQRLTVNSGGAILYGSKTYSGAVMSAYQKVYAMNFEIWKPYDLPAGWYATFDGFPVAQIAENRWVYGQLNIDGTIRPTNILVGSVIPSNVPGIVRIATVWSYGKYIDSPEFLKIQNYRCTHMGWLNDNMLNTLISWNSKKAGVWVWLGNRWKRFEPNSGEYTWQMLKRFTPYINDELRKNNVYFYESEPVEAADLARQWGMIWGGRVILTSLKNFSKDSGGSGESVTSMKDSSSSSSGDNSAPKENNKDSTPKWDVD